MPARQQGLAVSVRAPAKLFLGFRPAEADFCCFCAEITRHTNVPLRGSLPSSQLSCFSIPLDMMLVGPEEGICPGQACPHRNLPRLSASSIKKWMTKETCLSHWQIGDHSTEMNTGQNWIALDQDWSQFLADQDWIGLRKFLLF